MASVQETSNANNLAGVYRHPESGAEIVVRQHPLFGSAQADGVVRVGFVYVGPEGEVHAQKDEPAEEKALNKQTKSELLATAEKEDVSVDSDMTNKELAEAIQAARDEKGNN